jgi:hypothetical protein
MDLQYNGPGSLVRSQTSRASTRNASRLTVGSQKFPGRVDSRTGPSRVAFPLISAENRTLLANQFMQCRYNRVAKQNWYLRTQTFAAWAEVSCAQKTPV